MDGFLIQNIAEIQSVDALICKFYFQDKYINITDGITYISQCQSSLRIYTFVVSRAFMAGAASQAGGSDSSRAPGLTSCLQGSVNVHSDSASVLLYFILHI